MTILIAGSAGQVGSELRRRSWPSGLEPVALDADRLDITDAAAIADVMAEHSPKVVINAAAYTAVDRAETEREAAFAVNRDGPRLLAEACATTDVPLIHISTDYVFDGSKTSAYVEDDPIAPLGVYGKSKAAGEEVVRAILPAHVILRTAWVYSPFGNNFVKTMLRLAGERDLLRVVDDQHGCPTAASDIAAAIAVIADGVVAGRRDGFGTFHYCGGGATTWCGFARAVMAGRGRRGLSQPAVDGIATHEYPTPAQRPTNSVLDCERIARVWGIEQRPWWESLDEVLAELLD